MDFSQYFLFLEALCGTLYLLPCSKLEAKPTAEHPGRSHQTQPPVRRVSVNRSLPQNVEQVRHRLQLSTADERRQDLVDAHTHEGICLVEGFPIGVLPRNVQATHPLVAGSHAGPGALNVSAQVQGHAMAIALLQESAEGLAIVDLLGREHSRPGVNEGGL